MICDYCERQLDPSNCLSVDGSHYCRQYCAVKGQEEMMSFCATSDIFAFVTLGNEAERNELLELTELAHA